MKILENIKNSPKNLKNVSSENLGKNKEVPAVGKSQRSLWEHVACTCPKIVKKVLDMFNFFHLVFDQ